MSATRSIRLSRLLIVTSSLVCGEHSLPTLQSKRLFVGLCPDCSQTLRQRASHDRGAIAGARVPAQLTHAPATYYLIQSERISSVGYSAGAARAGSAYASGGPPST